MADTIPDGGRIVGFPALVLWLRRELQISRARCRFAHCVLTKLRRIHQAPALGAFNTPGNDSSGAGRWYGHALAGRLSSTASDLGFVRAFETESTEH